MISSPPTLPVAPPREQLREQVAAARYLDRVGTDFYARFVARGPALSSAAAVAIAVSVAVWLASLSAVDPRHMNGLGLISVLPPTSVAALALLAVSFCATLHRRRPPQVLLLAHVVALVVMVYGLPALVEPEPRFAVTWRHVGVIDTILQTGQVDPRIDAYFNWPGFFILTAFVAAAGGTPDLLAMASWAPVAVVVICVAPLALLMRTLSSNRRVVWLGIWFFCLGNWVGQDYLSPQAFGFFLYLVVLAITVTWLRATPAWSPPWVRMWVVPGSACRVWGSPQRAALVAVALLLFAVTVPSHQLTPFAILPGVAALVLAKRCMARGLPVAMAVMIGTWLSYMAVAYLAGHGSGVASGVGDVGTSVGEGVADRVRGDPDHMLVTQVRVGLTVALWALAVAGLVRRARRGHDDVDAALLMVGPMALPLMQPYGGEIALRTYLFTLPFAALFAALLIEGAAPAMRAWVGTAVTLGLTLVLLGPFILARYGNERMDWFSRDEVAAVDYVYRAAPKGSTLVAWTPSLPWQSRDYALHRYRVVTGNPDWSAVRRLTPGSRAQVTALERFLRAEEGGAWLVLTRSQKAQAELTGMEPRGSLDRLEAALRAAPAFRLRFANRDATVFSVRPGPEPRR
jgi:hypothetical protein